MSWGSNRNYAWMEDTIRLPTYQIKQVLNKLDEAFWALEEDAETLKEADRPLEKDLNKAKSLIVEALELMENKWEDKGLSRIDMAATDIEYAIKQIGDLQLKFYLGGK
jgi:hypothetical protein